MRSMAEGGPIMRGGARGPMRREGSKPYVRVASGNSDVCDSGLTGYVGELSLSFDEARSGHPKLERGFGQSFLLDDRRSSKMAGSPLRRSPRKVKGASAVWGRSENCSRDVTPEQIAAPCGDPPRDVEMIMPRANSKSKQGITSLLDADAHKHEKEEDLSLYATVLSRVMHNSPSHRTRSSSSREEPDTINHSTGASSSHRNSRKSKRSSRAGSETDQPPTVIVSCSRLIVESKKIVGYATALERQVNPSDIPF